MKSNRPARERGKTPVWIFFLILVILGVLAWGYYNYYYLPKNRPDVEPASTPVFDEKILTVGIDSRPVGMLFYAANHFIPSDKFKIRPVLLEDPNEKWCRMESGALDMCISTFPEFVLGAARHKPGKLLMFISSSRGADGLVVKGPINSVEDLVGKKIAVVPGSAGHYLLIKVLDSKAKSTSEVTLIPSPDVKSLFESFKTGDFIDAAALSEPYLSMSTGEGGRTLVATGNYFGIDEVLCVSQFALENRPKDIQTVVNSYFNLVYLARSNPGLAKSLITKKSGRSINEVDQLMSTVRFLDLADSRAVSPESISAGFQKTQQIWGIEGLPNANEKVDIENIIEYKFLQEAVVDNSLFDDSAPPMIDVEPVPAESPVPGPSAAPRIPRLPDPPHTPSESPVASPATSPVSSPAESPLPFPEPTAPR